MASSPIDTGLDRLRKFAGQARPFAWFWSAYAETSRCKRVAGNFYLCSEDLMHGSGTISRPVSDHIEVARTVCTPGAEADLRTHLILHISNFREDYRFA